VHATVDNLERIDMRRGQLLLHPRPIRKKEGILRLLRAIADQPARAVLLHRHCKYRSVCGNFHFAGGYCTTCGDNQTGPLPQNQPFNVTSAHSGHLLPDSAAHVSLLLVL